MADDETPDLSKLAESVTETADPIAPNVPDAPIDPEDTETRARVFDFLADGNRAKRARKEKAPKPPMPRMRANSHPFLKPLTDLYTSVGTIMCLSDPVCGMAIINNAEKCALALEDAARENEVLRRALTSLVQTSVWGAVIAAHAPIFMAIAFHHVPAIKAAMAGPGVADQAERYANGDETQ